MEDAEIKIRVILTDAALAGVLEEIVSKSAQLLASEPEAQYETLKARHAPRRCDGRSERAFPSEWRAIPGFGIALWRISLSPGCAMSSLLPGNPTGYRDPRPIC